MAIVDIAVVDYGMGNLRSVAKALEHVAAGPRVAVTSDPDAVRAARRVVFPGQGAMPDCMRELEAGGLRAAVVEAAASKPFLGICIGLQMLFEESEEGGVRGLGLLHGRVVRFPAQRMQDADGARLKVPHMGWNQLQQQRACPLLDGIPDGTFAYFVHSYYAAPKDAAAVVATTEYGVAFASVLWRDNLYATQFHPEKSQHWGLRILQNFFVLIQGKRAR